MAVAVTRQIEVSVETSFLEKRSDPKEQYFVWAYRITITNKSDESVQLLKRHWQITDAMGRMQEVRGQGVIGEQPVIAPGELYLFVGHTAWHGVRFYARQLSYARPLWRHIRY